MALVRSGHFPVQVDAAYMEEGVSVEAIGLLCYVIYKQDRNITITSQSLCDELKLKINKFRKILKELIEIGALEVEENNPE